MPCVVGTNGCLILEPAFILDESSFKPKKCSIQAYPYTEPSVNPYKNSGTPTPQT